MTPLHAQARALAEAGIKVFPCVEDGKQPATTHGFQDASADLAQIDAWWGENPNYNVALSPEDAGWAVIDIDPGGEASWIEALQQSGGYEPTYEVQTPRGGRHIYFAGTLPSTAGKLGSHVDTRGVGGYVLVPPSIVNGKPYEVAYDRPVVELPGWIESRLATRATKFEGDDGATDAPANLARGRDYLRDLVERGDIAISGRGGNNRTYQLFAFLKSLGISREVSLRQVLAPGGWNDHCEPPWSNVEIEAISVNAYRYGQNAAGADGVEGDAAESFGNTEAFREAMKASNTVKPSRYRLMSAADFDNEPEPKWIVQDLIPDDSIVLWIGPSQSFKSFLLLDVMLGVATGRATFGSTPAAGPVLYGAIEDLRNIGKGRRRAWQHKHEIASDPLENFRGSQVPFIGMPGDFDDWLAQIKAWLGDRKLKLLAIDTAGKTLAGLNENESGTVRTFHQMCDRLREEFGCSVVAIHHSGKDAERGARGSTAWQADFDSVIETIRPDKSLLNVEVVVRKHKNAPDGKRWTFKGHTLAGSLVFSATTPTEHREAEENSDFFAPSKIGRALVAAGAAFRQKAITTPELWTKLGGALGDEAGVRKLEKFAKNILKPYCYNDDGILYWWFNPAPGGAA